MNHTIIVGNIGTVFDGPDESLAKTAYEEWVEMSKTKFGRAAGEPITWLKGGEIHKEYQPDNSAQTVLTLLRDERDSWFQAGRDIERLRNDALLAGQTKLLTCLGVAERHADDHYRIADAVLREAEQLDKET